MSYFVIKIFAMIFMLTDHIGYLLLDNSASCRLVGRIAFPLFCFLLVNGYYHTSDEIKYLKRLLIFAIISEACHDIAFHGGLEIYNQNVFFTLALGLAGIIFTEKMLDVIKEKVAENILGFASMLCKVLVLLLFSGSGHILKVEFGWYGVLMIYALYLTYGVTNKHKVLMVLAIIAVNYVNILLVKGVFQAYSIMAVAYIYMFQEREVSVPKNIKILCYMFYPAHLIVLWIIKMLMIG